MRTTTARPAQPRWRRFVGEHRFRGILLAQLVAVALSGCAERSYHYVFLHKIDRGELYSRAWWPNPLDGATISPDGLVLAYPGYDDGLELWDMRTARLIRRCPTDQLMGSIVFSPDGKAVVTGDFFGTGIVMRSIATGKPIARLGRGDRVGRSIGALALSRDRSVLAVGVSSRMYGTSVLTPDGPVETPEMLAVTSDPGLRVTETEGTPSLFFHGPWGSFRQVIYVPGAADEKIAFSPDGNRIVSSKDRKLFFWSITTRKQVHSFETDFDDIRSVAFLPDGDEVIVVGVTQGRKIESELAILDARTGRRLQTLSKTEVRILNVVVAPDGQVALSNDREGTVKVWDLSNGRCLQAIRLIGALEAFNLALAIDSNGHRIVASGGKGDIYVFERRTGPPPQNKRDFSPVQEFDWDWARE